MRRLLVTLLVVLGLALAADRAALWAAEAQLAAEIQRDQDLAQRPDIDLLGFPFLTQAIEGRYDGGRLEIEDLRAERLRVDRLVIDLRDVEVPLSDLVTASVHAVPVGAVSGTAYISYTDLAAATGVPRLTIRPRGEKLELIFPVNRVGTSVQVTATARIGVVAQSVRMSSVEIQGVPVPRSVTNPVLAQIQSQLTVGALPYGLRLTDLRVTQDGLEITARARNTVLRPT